MEKKYQVFISSTYMDLKEERQKVRDAVLAMYQFPIGMEMFSAEDNDQWEIIKRTIDTSDIYILILGHRYGSVIKSGVDSGISYTEKEYRYAKKQGIPILAFIIDDSVAVLPGKIEKNPKASKKLALFKKDAGEGRIVKWWVSAEDLASQVSIALHHQIRNYGKGGGWIRYSDKEGIFENMWEDEGKYGLPISNINSIPLYAQEDQDTYHFISSSKEILFCARTGKGFLNGHYNILKDFISKGGKLRFLTCEKLNLLYDDDDEHFENKNNSLRFLKNLYKISPGNVECRVVDESLNMTYLFIDTGDKKFIEVKFVFQTPRIGKHPIFRINEYEAFYDEFYNELTNLWDSGHEVKLISK